MLQPPEQYERRLPGIVVTQQMHDDLKSISRATGISISELVRRAVDFFLSENANEISKISKQVSNE